MKEPPLASQIFSDIIAYMKYAKYLPDKQRRELWPEIVDRNKAMHLKKFPELKEEIEDAYQFIYDKKNLPSMRSMQFAGKPIELNPIRIYNCSFMHMDHPDAFSEAMELLLSGTGVGFSVQKHHVRKLPPVLGVQRPEGRQRKRRYLIGDSIEGWADAIKVLVESYFYNKREIDYDFRDIRSKGSLLLTSGGRAPGPEPLRECLVKIISVFENAIQERGRACQLKPIEVHDIMCYIAEAVLSGGIRRSAMISLFSLDDTEMLESKFGNWWELNPQRALANNSAMVLRSQIDEEVFFDLWKKIQASRSGEPGIFFSNSEEWGTNPCVVGNTKLAVRFDGNEETMQMKDVVSLATSGESLEVLSFNEKTGQKEFKKITAAALTKKNASLMKITDEKGNSVTCTPDHKIFTKNRGYVEARYLKETDVLEVDE